ncbi:MAG: L,D-transpeptidase family protein [Hyphomicrobiaceae bacterium]|nr:L,D-transpeptidase family protein [Hyphomicrobiaceae bacterium]
MTQNTDDTHARLTRRSLLASALGSAGGLAMAGNAKAQSAIDFFLQEQIRGQGGLDERFDDTARGVIPVTSTEPMFSATSAVNLERAVRQYSMIYSQGGWPLVPDTVTLRVGVRHDNVRVLRTRLMMSGDLDQQAGISEIFDSYVEAGVRRFQQRHGVVPDGVVRRDSFAALNIPVGPRLQQLETNLVRVRAMSGYLGDRYVMVNIPAAALEAVENGSVVSRHTAIVGKVDRQTPILSSRIHELNFNPYWTVPVSIIRRDLIPKMQEDPTYLARNRIRIFDWRSGDELQPEQIDWTTEQATEYMFRQDPGEINSLGTVKINFHNQHQVYLHDTPTRTLFGEDYRFLSSGCVRVQNIRELVTWLLRDEAGWNRARVDEVIRTGERLDVRITNPSAIYTNYITAWSTSDGIVNFRDDIYGRDGIPSVAQN